MKAEQKHSYRMNSISKLDFYSLIITQLNFVFLSQIRCGFIYNLPDHVTARRYY